MRKRRCFSREQLHPFEVNPPGAAKRLDGLAIFGQTRPLEIEIGFGKGAMLLAMAEQKPERQFLGIEKDRGLQLYVATRIARRGWNHVKVAYGDAQRWLNDWLSPGCAAVVHVYFPDPWWKRRHHKRRLFTPAFVEACYRILEPRGWLHVATDVEEYFEIIRQAMAAVPNLIPLSSADSFPQLQTNFLIKARQAQRAIWTASYQKSDAVPTRNGT